MILIAPAFYVRKDLLPGIVDQAKMLGALVSGRSSDPLVKIKADSSFLVEDSSMAQAINQDPYRLEKVSAKFMLESQRLARKSIATAKLNLPMLLVLGEKDRVVLNEKTIMSFFNSYRGPKTLLILKNAGHVPELDSDSETLKGLREFLAKWMTDSKLRNRLCEKIVF